MAFLIFLAVTIAGIAVVYFLQKRKVDAPPAQPISGTSVPNSGTAPQATPTPLVQTPVGPQVASTAAYTDASRVTPAPSTQQDVVDRNSRVLEVAGGWRKILAAQDSLTVPNAHGYLMIDAAEPDSEIALSLYKGSDHCKTATGKNDVTLQYAGADGDYTVVVQVSNVSGQGTVNRKGV